MGFTRRDILKLGAAAGAVWAARPPGLAALESTGRATAAAGRIRTGIRGSGQAALIRRPIPSSGEEIPIVGVGTARRYDVSADPADRDPLAATLRRFTELGGTLIDTAPSYGQAEQVVGDLVRDLGVREELFLATKVGAGSLEEATRQIGQSYYHLDTDVIDLLQIHNLRGIEREYRTLLELKEHGRIRYLGMTTSSDRQYEEFLRHMRTKTFDFIQVDYSPVNRSAETEILPKALDDGVAVLVNLPFARGSVFEAIGDRPLPDGAASWDIYSWGQFVLKWILSHPAVTCVIPGTATVRYAEDNLGAARGVMPDADARREMTQFFDSVMPS